MFISKTQNSKHHKSLQKQLYNMTESFSLYKTTYLTEFFFSKYTESTGSKTSQSFVKHIL